MRSLRQALQDHELIILRVIGEWWDIDLTGLQKDRCVQTLAESLPHLDVPQELIYLPHKEAEAIRAVVQGNGRMPAASFKRQFGAIREMGPGALEREEPWYEPQSAAEDLWYRGLIYKGLDQTDDGLVEYFYLPDEFLQQFEPADFQPNADDQPDNTTPFEMEVEAPKRPPSPPVISGQPAFGKTIDLAAFGVTPKSSQSAPQKLEPTPPQQPQVTPSVPTSTPPPPPPPPQTTPSRVTQTPTNTPNTITAAQTNAVDDMTTLLSLAQAGQLRVGHADLIAPYMQIASLSRLELLTTLAVELKFLREVDDGLYRPTRAAVGWLQQQREEQLRTLAVAWSTTAWNELRHMPTIQCEGNSWQNDPTSARAALLNILKHTTDWYALEDTIDVIKQKNPDFQRPNGNYDTWYIRDTASDTYLNGFEHWPQVEGRLIAYLVTTPMHWLGLTDIGEESYRLTPRALAWLNKDTVPDQPPTATPPLMIIDGNARLTLSQHVNRYKRFQASRIATMMPLSPNQTAGAIIYNYRLTPKSLASAKENSITPDRVIQFLEEASGGRIAGQHTPRHYPLARKGDRRSPGKSGHLTSRLGRNPSHFTPAGENTAIFG